MRFKAKLAPEQVSLLYSLVVPLSRLSGGTGEAAGGALWLRHGAQLALDDHHLRIAVNGKGTDTDGIVCYAELAAESGIFMEHRIESVAENNTIVMELDLVHLRIALQSISQKPDRRGTTNPASNAVEPSFTVLKLARRNSIPCLCLDAYTSSSNGGAKVAINHSIPVRMLRPTEFQQPPNIASPEVQLEWSTLQQHVPLRVVLDRLRLLSPIIYLQGNQRTGELTVKMETEGASIETFFSRLHPVDDPENDPATSSNSNDAATVVKVDSKKLFVSLLWQQQTALVSRAVICFSANDRLIVHADLHPSSVGHFTYYLPVHYLPADVRDE